MNKQVWLEGKVRWTERRKEGCAGEKGLVTNEEGGRMSYE